MILSGPAMHGLATVEVIVMHTILFLLKLMIFKSEIICFQVIAAQLHVLSTQLTCQARGHAPPGKFLKVDALKWHLEARKVFC